MSEITVSIITSCYNSQSTIEDTIKSVISQDYQNIEYIIIDGESSDNTLNIVNNYSNKIAIISSEKDNGIYDALNRGINLATGDIVGFLHSDDVFDNDTVISDIVQTFNTKNSDAVYTDLVYVDRLNTEKIIRYWKAGNYKKGSFYKGWMPPHPTFYVKKDIYEKYGTFNLELKSAADYEIMLRFIHKYQIGLNYLEKVTVRMRVGGLSNASLRNRIRANREDKKAWLMNDLKPKPFTLIMKPLSKVLQFIKKH